MLLDRMLRHYLRRGYLGIIDHRGRRWDYGDRVTGPDWPSVTLKFNHAALPWRLVFNPDPGLGEAYMNGDMEIVFGDLESFFALLGGNMNAVGMTRPPTGFSDVAGYILRHLHQWNPMVWARRNVAHHYDLGNDFYDLFLDADRQYSCAYFDLPDLTLEQAQIRKKEHIARKLRLPPGGRVLDIGCGWGGLALSLAREADVEVLGITLSTEQLHRARARAQEAGLADRVKFELTDYRKLEGTFDRIVSVGMFEHVGVPHYRTFFRKVSDLLSDDGMALLHSIGRSGRPDNTSPFIRKYIFPGGYIPALSEVLPAIEKCRLWVTDLEVLRLHYAETLRHWRQRFLANREQVEAMQDARFCRMWEFYLAASEWSFRFNRLMVFQAQLSKNIGTAPPSRDYIYRAANT